MTVTPDASLLTDKVVVVTGAAQGIGKAAALSAAAHGADIAICDRKPELEATADSLYVAIFDQNVRRPVQAGSRVDHASVLNEQRWHGA